MKNHIIRGVAAAALLAGGAAIAQTAIQPQSPAPAVHVRTMKTMTRSDAQARVATLFARFDANKDGFIAQDELASLPMKKLEGAQHRRGSRFDRLDANKDGQITQTEADAARAQRAKARGGHGALFARADKNKDGVITRAEFEAFRPQLGPVDNGGARRGGGGMASRLFTMADANKDGRVSLAEAQQAALTHFDSVDANRDGTITPDERQQARQARHQHKPA